LISLVISIIAWWAIFSKAGYSGCLELVVFHPDCGSDHVLVFAFGQVANSARARDAPSATGSLPVSVGAHTVLRSAISAISAEPAIPAEPAVSAEPAISAILILLVM